MSTEPCAIGIDIGGTKIEIAIVTSTGKVESRILIPTRVELGPLGIQQEILLAIQKLLSQTSLKPEAVGVGMAGQIAAETGEVIFAPNLDWHHVPLGETIKSALNLPVIVTNDVRAAAFGEWKFGAGKNCDDLLCLMVGTGIGGGIISRGRLMNGSSNAAGEIGHIIVDHNGPLCHCGNNGCMEAFAGGWALAKHMEDLIKNRKNEYWKAFEGKEITGRMVLEAYQKGDPLAKEVIDQAQKALIAGTISLIHAFNPERIIFSGGIINGMPSLIENIEVGVRAKALKASLQNLRFLPGQLKTDVGIVGAAAMALEMCAPAIKSLRKNGK